MLSWKRIEKVLSRATEAPGPKVTAYLRIDPEATYGNVQALVTRIRSTFGDLDVPNDITDRIVEELTTGPAEARTLVIIEGPNVSERLQLHVDIPVVDQTTGHFEASYGEEAYTAPLLMALDRHERLGVIFVDREHIRVFETYLGAIEEVYDSKSEPEPDQSHVASSSKQVRPAYQAVRDDAHHDRHEEHKRTVRDRFYKHQMLPLRRLVQEHQLDRMILMGPERSTAAFERQMPPRLSNRVAAHTSSLPDTEASPGSVLEKIKPIIEELEQDRQRRVVEQIKEGASMSIHGTAQALEELQEGRIDTLVVPWRPGHHQTVYRATDSGWVGVSKGNTKKHVLNGGALEKVELMDVLPSLAEAYGVHLEFLYGEARDELGNGELAALRRW